MSLLLVLPTCLLPACGNDDEVTAERVRHVIEQQHPKQCGGLVVHDLKTTDGSGLSGTSRPATLQDTKTVDGAEEADGYHGAYGLRFGAPKSADGWLKVNLLTGGYLHGKSVVVSGNLTPDDWKRLKNALPVNSAAE